MRKKKITQKRGKHLVPDEKHTQAKMSPSFYLYLLPEDEVIVLSALLVAEEALRYVLWLLLLHPLVIELSLTWLYVCLYSKTILQRVMTVRKAQMAASTQLHTLAETHDWNTLEKTKRTPRHSNVSIDMKSRGPEEESRSVTRSKSEMRSMQDKRQEREEHSKKKGQLEVK